MPVVVLRIVSVHGALGSEALSARVAGASCALVPEPLDTGWRLLDEASELGCRHPYEHLLRRGGRGERRDGFSDACRLSSFFERRDPPAP